jgi:hypothetical protein
MLIATVPVGPLVMWNVPVESVTPSAKPAGAFGGGVEPSTTCGPTNTCAPAIGLPGRGAFPFGGTTEYPGFALVPSYGKSTTVPTIVL